MQERELRTPPCRLKRALTTGEGGLSEWPMISYFSWAACMQYCACT